MAVQLRFRSSHKRDFQPMRKQLVGHNPQRPNVDFRGNNSGTLSSQELRRQILPCSCQKLSLPIQTLVQTEDLRAKVVLGDLFWRQRGHTKVNEHNIIVRVKKDIGQLNISMNNSLRVNLGQHRDNLVKNLPNYLRICLDINQELVCLGAGMYFMVGLQELKFQLSLVSLICRTGGLNFDKIASGWQQRKQGSILIIGHDKIHPQVALSSFLHSVYPFSHPQLFQQQIFKPISLDQPRLLLGVEPIWKDCNLGCFCEFELTLTTCFSLCQTIDSGRVSLSNELYHFPPLVLLQVRDGFLIKGLMAVRATLRIHKIDVLILMF